MAKGCGKTLFKDGNGQSMVEFALILPLMVLIIAGIFDLGRAFFASITITNAAREGARYGTLNPDYYQGICDATKNEAQSSGITLNDNNVTIMCSSSMTCPPTGWEILGCTENQPIIVQVNYNYNEMLLRFFFPSGINMQRQVEMLVP
jgi:Flp pilus assembly protein TadG